MTSEAKLIAKIHAEFDTAQDRLLQEAQVILSNAVESKETAIESIGERLAKVGFINTPVVKKAVEIRAEKIEKQKVLVETKEQADLIQYYKQSYPFMKFLTESELDRICVKYNLVYAPIANYVKDVPEKNLRDIETAQELKEMDSIKDFSHLVITKFWKGNEELQQWLQGKLIPFNPKGYHDGSSVHESDTKAAIMAIGYNGPFGEYIFRDATIETVRKSGLYIAAPETHFNTSGLTKKGLGLFEVFKTEVKDPIVFRYVKGGIQVVTKWGLEASDPALVVPELN